jgi:hypothetical protein
MRRGIILTAAFTALSVTGAHAQDWCGFSAQPHAIVQCGYSSLGSCESAIGKGAMCYVNPYLALDTKRARPAATTMTPSAARG